MRNCQECGSEADFLYSCRECGERYCADHVDPAAHDCPETPAGPGATADTRQVVLGIAFFALIVVSFAGFVWVLGPSGPFAGVDGGEAVTTTAADSATGRLVLQAVNDVRSEANRSPIGSYEPLADRAGNSSWTVPESDDAGATDIGGGVTCSRMDSLEFDGTVEPGRSATEAEAVVAAWDGDPATRQVLLADGWDLGGASVERSDGTLQVRLVVCNSTDG